MFLLIVYALLALGVSFVCSVMEAVLLSLTPAYIESRDGALATTRKLREFNEDIERPLAAILGLNTVAHTAGAVGVGAQSATVFGSAYVGLTSAVLTLLILVVSEIIPKTLGAVYWRSLAAPVARLLALLVWLLWPLVLLSQAITRLFARDVNGPDVRPEEIEAMAEMGGQQGVLQDREAFVLKNVLRLREIQTKEVMTPRKVVFLLDQEQTVGEVIRRCGMLEFSRIPVYRRRKSNVTGYVLKDEILLRAAQDAHDVKLAELKRECHRVADEEPLISTLETLTRTPGSLAYTVDYRGRLAGVITLEDVVETLLGLEIVDESDSVADLRKLAEERKDAGRR